MGLADQAMQDAGVSSASTKSLSAQAALDSVSRPASQQVTAIPSQSGGIMSGIGNLIYGATKGAADMVQGPAQMVLHGAAALSGDGPAGKWVKGVSDQFDRHLTNQESQYQADTPGSIAAGIGRFASGMAPFLLSGGSSAATTTPALARGIANAAVQGGAFSATNPVLNATQDNFAGEKGKQIALGAAVSGAAVPIANTIGRIISPNVRPEVKALLDEGVGLTPGQILGGTVGAIENKATSIPVLGDQIKNAQRRAVDDLNIAAYRRALDPIGQSPIGKIGNDGVQDVSDKLSAAYNSLLPKLQFKADQQFIADAQNLTQLASNLPAPQAAQFTKIFQNKVFSRLGPQGTIDGQALKGVESELGSIAKGYHSDPSFDNRQLGDAVSEIQSAIRSNLARSNPEDAATLNAINEGYANYARIRQAAASTGAVNGVFTPAQLQAAVRAGDGSVGKGNFAKGSALMQDLSAPAKGVLSSYPDSGTVGRGLIAALGGAAMAAPSHPILTGAMLAGGTAAMAPYTSMGQKIAAALLAKRPDVAPTIANAIKQSGAAAGISISPALINALTNGAN